MNIITKKEKNKELRKRIVKVNKLGVMYMSIGEKIDMKSSSFTQWRMGIYDFGEERLSKLDNVLKKYEDFLS